MTQTNTDRIERSITIDAPVEKVYDAIATPANFGAWFSNGVEGDFEPGSQPVLDEGQYGKFRIAIVAADRPKYFAWRWVSGSHFVPQGFTDDPLNHPNTLVEFFLEPDGEATTVRLVESGFDSLPDEYREANLEDNNGGWDYQLPRLDLFVTTGRPE